MDGCLTWLFSFALNSKIIHGYWIGFSIFKIFIKLRIFTYYIFFKNK